MPDAHPASPGGATDVLPGAAEQTRSDDPWQVVLWNDPVNTTDYVTLTLMRVLTVPGSEAQRLMLLAHTEGRVVVTSADLGRCREVATALMAAQLWATLERVSA